MKNEWMKRDDLFELKVKSMATLTCGVIFCSSPTRSCHTALLQKPDTKSDTGHETTPCSAGCGCGCPVLSWDDGTTWHCNTLEKRKAESGKYIKDQFSKISTPTFVSMQKSQEIWSRQWHLADDNHWQLPVSFRRLFCSGPLNATATSVSLSRRWGCPPWHVPNPAAVLPEPHQAASPLLLLCPCKSELTLGK